MKVDAETAPRVRRQRFRAHRLAGLGLAEAHRVSARARAAKIVIKGDHAMYFRAREVQLFGDQGNGGGGNISKCRLDGVQHFQERSGTSLQIRRDALHYGAFGRG